MVLNALNEQIKQEMDEQIIAEMLRDVEAGMEIAKLAKEYGSKDWNRYRPLRDQAIVIDDPQEDKTGGGIWMPPSHRQGRWIFVKGTVVSVGPGSRHPKSGVLLLPPVEVGQRITYLHHYGTRLEKLSGNEQYLRMMSPDQIAGIIEEE